MGKVGRYTAKPELGPEETKFGEVRERGEQLWEAREWRTRKNKKAQRPVGRPTIGAFGLARL